MRNLSISGKRVRKLKASVMIVVLLLAACSTGVMTDDSSEKVTLTMWFWRGSGFEKIIPEFEKAHPNIDIQPQIMRFDDAHSKLFTTLSAGSGAPDIAMVDISQLDSFLQYPGMFYNLNDFGAPSIKNRYLDWKWNQAVRGDHVVGLPTDIGPTVMYYRKDLFEKAGLPTEPDEVTKRIQTWEDYIEAGIQLKRETGKYMISSPWHFFMAVRDQGDHPYFNRKNQLVLGTDPQTKKAWNLMIEVKEKEIAGTYGDGTPEEGAALNKGDVSTVLSAAWKKGHIESNAPDAKGKWRAALMPEGTANMAGSFLTLPKQGKHPEEAYQAIQWLLAPEQQLDIFEDEGNFPSTPSVYDDPAIHDTSYEYWGGQKMGRLFAKAAKRAKANYMGPEYRAVDSLVEEQIDLIIHSDKDPKQAWKDLLERVQNQLKRG
ncbi:ABC transporter substrate-binding protein [Paludifilum halophilum]|uniref:ABC transporter substrate-binding protein n=1 Tax=Paludifilum halophilum TaxID=1642702 RepID=UPI001F0B34D0|nr:ABC transporter substrate-binding protein [Paludifilum halophilum]